MQAHNGALASPVCYEVHMFDAICFAGGGNRCYWQGGFFEALAERFDLAPRLAVGASAGAFAGIYSLLGLGPGVRKRVLASCGPHRRNFDFSAWRRGEPLCPVGPLYRALILDALDSASLKALRHRTDFQIAVSRLPRTLPPMLGAALGIGAYQLEKRLLHPVHPRFGRKLGFRPEFIAVRDLDSPDALADALIATFRSSLLCRSRRQAAGRWCCSPGFTAACRRSPAGPTRSRPVRSRSGSSTSPIRTASGTPTSLAASMEPPSPERWATELCVYGVHHATLCGLFTTHELIASQYRPTVQQPRMHGIRSGRNKTMYIATLIRSFSAWRKYRTAVRELASLDDRALRDIGLNRTQIRHAAWRGR